jgi:glucosyl-3-phosphoglycerate synthase
MIEETNQMPYLTKVIIALSAEDHDDYEEALRVARKFKTPCEVAWCNKPEVTRVIEELKHKGLDVVSLSGKGKDVWIASGIAQLDLFAFALHDADITTYDRMIQLNYCIQLLSLNWISSSQKDTTLAST